VGRVPILLQPLLHDPLLERLRVEVDGSLEADSEFAGRILEAIRNNQFAAAQTWENEKKIKIYALTQKKVYQRNQVKFKVKIEIFG
jgi:hypothetical protein